MPEQQPKSNFEAGQGFAHRGHIWQYRRTLSTCHTDGMDSAALNARQGRSKSHKEGRNIAAYQIDYRRAPAFI